MWEKILTITNPFAYSTQIQHAYSYRNLTKDIQTTVLRFEVTQMGHSGDLTLSFSTGWSMSTFMSSMYLDLYPDFPCSAHDRSDGTFTIETSDKFLKGYLINHLVNLDHSFSSHAEELAGVLSIDLTKAHSSFPVWIKTGDLESIQAKTCFRSRLPWCPISSVEIETKNTGEVNLKLTARPLMFNDLLRKLSTSGCSMLLSTNSFYFSSGPGRYQRLVEFIAKLGQVIGSDLEMPIAELMGSEPMSSFIQTTLRAVFSPAYDAERFKPPSYSSILEKHGYEPKNMPDEYLDPIFHVFLDDPVLVPGFNHPGERSEIEKWLETSPQKINPYTGEHGLEISDLKPDNITAAKISVFVGEMVQKAAESSNARKSRCIVM